MVGVKKVVDGRRVLVSNQTDSLGVNTMRRLCVWVGNEPKAGIGTNTGKTRQSFHLLYPRECSPLLSSSLVDDKKESSRRNRTREGGRERKTDKQEERQRGSPIEANRGL